jgi:hypothetical protein
MFLVSCSTAPAKCLNPARIINWANAVSRSCIAKPGDPLHNPVDRLFIVPQLRQNRNYIIADIRTTQQAFAIQCADVDQPVFEEQTRPAQRAFHVHGRFTHVKQNLPRELSEMPPHAERVFNHPERHRRVIAALQLKVDEVAVDSPAE